jgi:hypothetical protein
MTAGERRRAALAAGVARELLKHFDHAGDGVISELVRDQGCTRAYLRFEPGLDAFRPYREDEE